MFPTIVKKVQHKKVVIRKSFVTKNQNMKQKSKRNRNSLVAATWMVTIVASLGRLIGRYFFVGRIEEMWCVSARDPRDKVVWK